MTVAIVSHVAAVSGGRILRTWSAGIGRAPGEVARKRLFSGFEATSRGGVLPRARGQVPASPGQAIGIKGRDQPPRDERRGTRDVELGWHDIPEQVQQVRGNLGGV